MLSKFTAKIQANHKNFMKKIEEAKKAAKELQDNIRVKIKADISDAVTGIQTVKQRVQDLSNDRAVIEVDVNSIGAVTQLENVQNKIRDFQNNLNQIRIRIFANAHKFHEDVNDIEARILILRNSTVYIEIKANITDFMAAYLRVRTLVQELSSQSATVNVNGAIADVIAAIREVKLAILTLTNVVIQIQGDNQNFMAAYLAALAAQQQLNGNGGPSNKLIRQWRRFTNAMQGYANVIRAFGEVSQQITSGALMMSLPALVPIVSTLIGLVGNLGVMIGVVATSAFALVTAFGAAAIAAAGFAAVAIPTIKTLFDENAKLTAQQQVARNSFDQMKKTYEGLVKATEAPVLQAFTSAMNATDKILKYLTPMIQSASGAVAGLMNSLNQSVDSQPLQDFFNFLNKDAAGILTSLGQGLGYFIQGLLNMMTAFAPLAVDTAKGFREMGQGFAEWANGLSNSDRFQALMDYVRETMPTIRAAFGDAIVGIVEFFTAFSGQGKGFIQSFADMMAAFREWASSLGENQSFQLFLSYIEESTPKVLALIGSLWNLILELGKALAPVGLIMLDFITSISTFFTELLSGNPILQKFVGWFPVIAGVISILVPFILAVVSQLNLLKGAWTLLSSAFSKIGPLFNTVVGWFARLGPIISTIASRALPILVRAFGLLSGPIGWAIMIITTLITIGIALYKNWDVVSAKASEIWGAIKDSISKAMTKVGEAISTGWQNAVDWTKEKLTNLVESVTGFFKGMWDGAVEWLGNILTSLSETWDSVTAYLSGINLLDIGKNIIQGLVDGLKKVPVVGSVIEIGENLVGAFKKFFKIKSPSRLMESISQYIPQGVAKGITGALSYITVAANKMGQAAIPNFEQTVSATKSMMEKISSVIAKTKTKSDAFTQLENFANQQVDLEAWSAKEQAAYWQYAATKFKEGTDERIKAQVNYNQAMKSLKQQQFDNEKTFMDKLVKYNRLSLTDQIKAYEVYMKQYEQGSDERIYYEEKLYDTKKEIHDKIQSLSEDYLSSQQELIKKQKDGEKEIRDEQLKTFNDRKSQIRDSIGLFDEYKGSEDVSGAKLLGNLEGQVDVMYAWIEDLQMLTARGLEGELIAELQQMGVSAANEIQALASMTDAELEDFRNMWNTKNALAETQTRIEMPGFEQVTEAKVNDFNEGILTEMDELKTQFEKDVFEIRNGAENEFDLLNASLPEIGRNAMTKLIESMRAMESPLKNQMANISEIIRSTFTDVFGMDDNLNAIGSGLLGINPELTTSMNVNPSISQSNTNIPQDIPEQAPVQVTVINEWDGEQVRTYINKENDKDSRINKFKRG